MGRWKGKGGKKVGEVVGGGEKGWRSVNIKKKMLKTIIGKIGKKKYNNLDANVVQLECNNNICYVSAFKYIYIYIYIYKG